VESRRGDARGASRAAAWAFRPFFYAGGRSARRCRGGLPWRYGRIGTVKLPCRKKENPRDDGKTYVLERAIRTITRSCTGSRDTAGNSYSRARPPFQSVCAMRDASRSRKWRARGRAPSSPVKITAGHLRARIVERRQQFPKADRAPTVRKRRPEVPG